MRGGEAGKYSPGASSALTQIVPYAASLYTIFHSVIYNSVESPQYYVMCMYASFFISQFRQDETPYHRIKDDRIENYGAYFGFISK